MTTEMRCAPVSTIVGREPSLTSTITLALAWSPNGAGSAEARSFGALTLRRRLLSADPWHRLGQFNIRAYTPCMNYCGHGASVENVIRLETPSQVMFAVGVVIFITRTLESSPVAYLSLRTRFCSVNARSSPDAGNGRFQRFLENAETIQEGAARETLEEANARVHNLELYTLFSLPHIQVYMFIEQNSPTRLFAGERVSRLDCTRKGHSLG